MKRISIALVLALSGTLVLAQTATPRVDQREARQQDRITQGVQNGSLTAQETQRLEAQQARIAQAEAAAKADAKVTPQERARLHHKQNHASRNIKHAKHNARTAP